MPETVVDRFLRYVQIDTQSKPDVEQVPSTEKQFDLAKLLVKELQEIGIEDAHVDDHCYVYATLPPTEGYENKKVLGLIAHMDTSPDAPGKAVPMIWKDYDGKTIELPVDDVKITPEENPELSKYIGQDLITSDGSSLLGADDKAGVAEIVAAMERVISEGIPHGKIRIGFTPDEEVAKGTAFFDVEAFGAEYAFTMDGSEPGELENENFNAATAIFNIKGYNVHPGYAKDKMRNSIRAASFLASLIPKEEAPETTDGWEGYLHPFSVTGTVEDSTVKVLIRDFSEEGMEKFREYLRTVPEKVTDIFPGIEVDLEIKESYRNMKEVLDKHPHVMEVALQACRNAGMEPKVKNIRGGTDGARLCFMGLPTPNVFTGGINFHGKQEFISIQSMEKAVEVIIEMVKLGAEIE